MLLGGPTFGQDDGPERGGFALRSIVRSSRSIPRTSTPARRLPPRRSRPRLRRYSYPDGPQSSRFLLGDVFGLRRLSEELGLSVYTSFTQFEQGVAAGGLRQAFALGRQVRHAGAP